MRPGRFLSATLWLFLTVAAASTAVAQSPFAGTWKLNQEKSQLAGDTLKFGPAEGQAIGADGGGRYLLLSRGRQELRPAVGRPRDMETDQRRMAGPPSIARRMASC